MSLPSPLFTINGITGTGSVAIAAGGAVVATLIDVAGVAPVTWEIERTDDSGVPGDYTFVQSGSVGQTYTGAALALGSGAVIKCTVSGGYDPSTDSYSQQLTFRRKFYVAIHSREVLIPGETAEDDYLYLSSATYGGVKPINEMIRTGTNLAGPGASTNLAIARWNGAGGTALLNSTVTVSGVGTLAGVNGITFTGTTSTVGDIRFTSTGSIYHRNGANTANLNLIRANGSQVFIGDPGATHNGIIYETASGKTHLFRTAGAAALTIYSDHLRIGSDTLPSSGTIRMPANAAIAVRCSATANNLNFIKSTGDNIYIGTTTAGQESLFIDVPTDKKIYGRINSVEKFTISTTQVGSSVPYTLPSYTVVNLPAGLDRGTIAYCTNEVGGATIVFYDGSDWRRQTDLAIASS